MQSFRKMIHAVLYWGNSVDCFSSTPCIESNSPGHPSDASVSKRGASHRKEWGELGVEMSHC